MNVENGSTLCHFGAPDLAWRTEMTHFFCSKTEKAHLVKVLLPDELIKLSKGEIPKVLLHQFTSPRH